jgi:hypothetical protein
MIIVWLLSPEPWWVSTTEAYSGVGADIVMESISRFDHDFGEEKAHTSDIALITTVNFRIARDSDTSRRSNKWPTSLVTRL